MSTRILSHSGPLFLCLIFLFQAVALTLSIMSATGNITPCCMAINLVLPHYGPGIIEQELWNEVFGSMDLFSFKFF